MSPVEGDSGYVKVFGCRPHTDRATGTGAGVRKPARDETASRTVGGVPPAQLWGFKGPPEPDRIAPQGSREVIGGREAVLMMRCGHQFGSGRVRMEHDCSTVRYLDEQRAGWAEGRHKE